MRSDSRERLQVLRELLGQGRLSTQDELRTALERQSFAVTQSTISRDLRKIGAVKATDPQGQTVYRLPEESALAVSGAPLADLITDIVANPSLIVIHTLPGSASLVARHLDQVRPAGILGTIAGDDTIFVAPADAKGASMAIHAIRQSLQVER
jgi:transcriptional regulator of arginine metabolism